MSNPLSDPRPSMLAKALAASLILHAFAFYRPSMNAAPAQAKAPAPALHARLRLGPPNPESQPGYARPIALDPAPAQPPSSPANPAAPAMPTAGRASPPGRAKPPAHKPAPARSSVAPERALAAQLGSRLVYPAQSIANNEQGTSLFDLYFSAEGKIIGSALVRTSGYPDLDRAAARALLGLPAIPELAGISLRFPVEFKLAP